MPPSTVPAQRCGHIRVTPTSGALRDTYDGLLVDLDGTLICGTTAIPGTTTALAAAALPVMYVTNNASRSAESVSEMLTGLGFTAAPGDVVTSAHAAVSVARQRLPQGGRALIVGAPSFRELVAQSGFTVVTTADDAPDVVFQGLNKQLTWSDLAEGALAIRGGALWIASNTDTTMPSERGLVPGNGSMVAAMEAATGTTPIVAGKPGPMSMISAAERLGARRPLVIGDRLDTDIAGGCAADMDTLMVLTGVSTRDDAHALPRELQPSYIAETLDALNVPPLSDGGH